MNDETKTEKTEEKAPAVEILRGRMPVAMVYLIRFGEDGTDSELARKFRTTNGKVNDIKKGRNFGYITEDTKFSQEEIDKALERAANLGEYADDVTEELRGMTVASDEDVAAFEARRKSTRKPRGKTAQEAKAQEADESPEADAEAEEEVNLDDLID